VKDEKLVLIKEKEKDEILASLNTLIEEIHLGTETLKGSVIMIQRLVSKEIAAFDEKVSDVTKNLLEATRAIETLLSED